MTGTSFSRVVRVSLFAAAAVSSFAGVARASDFDDRGNLLPDASYVDFEDFVDPERYVLADTEEGCLGPAFEVVERPDAISGTTVASLTPRTDCLERFLFVVPLKKASYRASVWVRHGTLGARLTASYPEETGRPLGVVALAPTGRATSDGWIELASNDLSIDATLDPKVYVRVQGAASDAGVEIDAMELVESGVYREELACEGRTDPICGEDALCVGGRCIYGDLSVPPLPSPEVRDQMIDTLSEKLRFFFGGQKTRTEDLPVALATLDRARAATTPWKFWNDGVGRAIRELHDWHTNARSSILENASPYRLNACFIEGDADLSHAVWPSHPLYKDILVSHAGTDSLGLAAGDRLVAVDGEHPISWARRLIDDDWSYHVASDSSSFADFPEALGGGSGLIIRYARTISILRCTPAGCADEPENIRVRDLVGGQGGPRVSCDNRPFYHLGGASPDPGTHRVGFQFYQGLIAETLPEERIYGMVFDTLYGGGDPNGFVNGTLRSAVSFWKENARGVILDHRAGNGGTIDAPQYVTELVRPPLVIAGQQILIPTAAYDGPSDLAAGLVQFQLSMQGDPYQVGSPTHDPTLPVALILHRDGSASDYLPYGMKGAPKVRLFAPGPTAGAFSTFIEFAYWGGITFQLASGDTYGRDGTPLIGRGVLPDQIVLQKQSDLVAGKDSLHEAALAWVRQELKP